MKTETRQWFYGAILLTAIAALAAFASLTLGANQDEKDKDSEKQQYAVFPPITGEQQIVILRVLDGDTVDVGYIVPVRIRLFGIDAPEIRGREKELGILSKKALEEILHKGRIVKIKLHGKGKFGRVLGTFFPEDTFPLSINDWMIGQGFASPYDI